ncbi:hypothetical protein PSTT_06059, partial [Puccinia striiformis]
LCCTTQSYSNYSARTSGPPGMDTQPSPPTSGFHITTTHNPAQCLKIQEQSNQPPTTWPVCSRSVKTGSFIVDFTPSALFKARNLWSNLLNGTGENSPFQSHSIVQTRRIAPRKHLIPINSEPYEGIFFEETPVDRTLIAPVPNNDVAAPGVQAPTAPVDANQAAGTPRPTVPVSLVMADPAVEIEVPPTVADSGADDGSLITLDYCLYVSTFNHLTSAKWKNKKKNDSEKIMSTSLDCLMAATFRFHFYIPNSHAFPSKRNYYVTSEAEYQAFLEEIVRKPNSKVFIRMCMDKPGAKAKSQEVIRHQEDSLAIAVGSQEEVVNLERLRARHDQNPHSDTRGDPIAPWVIKLRVHLENRANTRPSETIFIQDPEHLGLALRVTHERLWAWARVLQQRTVGNVTPANEHVDLNHPLRGANWVWEPRASISPIKSRTGPSTPLPGPFGLPSASTTTPPAIFANQAAQPPTTPSASVPVPAVVTPLVSAGPVPASARAAPATPLNPDIHPALVADDQSWIMNSIPLTIPGSADSSEIDFLTPDNSHVVVRRSSGASESSVEYLDDSISQPLDSHLGEPGPSRKIARSPHGPAGFKGKGKCTQFKRS